MYKHKRISVVDTSTGEHFNNHRVYAVSYETQWQILRRSLYLGTDAKAREAQVRLESYIRSVPRDDLKELRCRYFRVLNYLAAVPIGQTHEWGGAYMPKAREQFIINMRETYRREQRDLGLENPEYWDWAIVRRTTRTLLEKDENKKEIRTILYDLRMVRGRRQEPKPELRYYLTILEACLQDAGVQTNPPTQIQMGFYNETLKQDQHPTTSRKASSRNKGH